MVVHGAAWGCMGLRVLCFLLEAPVVRRTSHAWSVMVNVEGCAGIHGAVWHMLPHEGRSATNQLRYIMLELRLGAPCMLRVRAPAKQHT